MGLAALGYCAGEGDVVRGGISSRGVPARPADAHGAGAGVDRCDEVILDLCFAGSDELEVEVHGVLEFLGVDGRLVAVVDDPAAVAQQDRQEVDYRVVLAVAAVDEALLAVGLCLFADGEHVVERLDGVCGVACGLNVLLVEHEDGNVAVVWSKVNIVAYIADRGGRGDDVVVELVAEVGQVGEHAVFGELSHPRAVYHAQVVGTLLVDGVEGDAGIQVGLGKLLYFAFYVVLFLELRKALLDNVCICACTKNQVERGGRAVGRAALLVCRRAAAGAACGHAQCHCCCECACE